MESILNCYNTIKRILTTYQKKGYFEMFSSTDIFMNIYVPKRDHLLTFIESFYGESYGIQLFHNQEGLNYVHDIFTTKEDVVTVGDCDSIVAVFTPKDELSDDCKEYLHKLGKKVTDKNLILYKFEPGYGRRFANKTEYNIMMNELFALSSILENELEDIKEAFKNNTSVITFIDEKKLEYYIRYRDIPILEKMPKKTKADLAFVEEFKDKEYVNDECYLFATYIPFVIKNTNVRPLLIYYTMPDSGVTEFKYIIDEKKDYKSCIFGILDELFTKYGLPVKLNMNNRTIYSIVSKTLDELKIETSFIREDEESDFNANRVVGSIYEKTNDGYIESEDAMKLLLDVLNEASKLDVDEFAEYDIDSNNNGDDSDDDISGFVS